MNAEQRDLLACPHCGNAGNRDPRHSFHWNHMQRTVRVQCGQCGQCGATGPFARITRSGARAEDEALRLWNERKMPNAKATAL